MQTNKIFFYIFVLFFVSVLSNLAAIDYYVSPDGNNSDGLSWENAWNDIQYAIDNVESPAAESITINLSASVFDLQDNDIDIDRSFTDLTICGVSASDTFVQAVSEGTATERVFDITEEENVILQNITIRYGNLVDKYECGAGIRNSGILAIYDCAIKYNSAQQFGAGIWSNNDLTIEKTEISYNTITSTKDYSVGSGLYMEADNGSSLNFNATNLTVSNNSTSIVKNTYGVGIYLRSKRTSGHITATFMNCTIADNEYLDEDIAGKGMYLDNSGSMQICITNCVFDNGCQNNYCVHGEGELTFNRCDTICSDESMPLGRDSGNLNMVDPLLDELALNNSGNGTYTHNIDASSPAYDSGSGSGAPLVDQRGVARDDSPDIGAYEFTDDGPLPVTLSNFTAVFQNSTAIINWTTQTENNNLGWNIYRSDSEDFSFSTQLTADLISGAGTTSIATEYNFTDPLGLESGISYWYWLESISFCGETELYDPVVLTVPINGEGNNTPVQPDQYGLKQNYPNPFNPNTEITFALPQSDDCEIIIYDATGRKIKELFKDRIEAETTKSVIWNGTDDSGRKAASGIYFYKMKAGSYSHTKKMILLK